MLRGGGSGCCCGVDFVTTGPSPLLEVVVGPMKLWIMSIGTGNMMVEFFSADMELSVCKKKVREHYCNHCLVSGISGKLVTCKYRNWMAAGDSETISAASRRARDAFCSPSAAITCCQINISQNTSPLPLPGNVQHIANMYMEDLPWRGLLAQPRPRLP